LFPILRLYARNLAPVWSNRTEFLCCRVALLRGTRRKTRRESESRPPPRQQVSVVWHHRASTGGISNEKREEQRERMESGENKEFSSCFSFHAFVQTEKEEQQHSSTFSLHFSSKTSPKLPMSRTQSEGLARLRTSTCLCSASNDAAALRPRPRRPRALEPSLAPGKARADGRAWNRRPLGAAELAWWDE
jgi:hypothetical protein